MTIFFERHRDKIAFAGPDECWLWAAAKNDGYGWVRARGKVRKAHREAFEAVNGPTPDGLVVRHKCDVRACVNRAHLELGTRADNVRDMVERGRQARGEAVGSAKLTEAHVREIRADYTRGSRTHGQQALARRFGVDQSLISLIVSRQSWAHVTKAVSPHSRTGA